MAVACNSSRTAPRAMLQVMARAYVTMLARGETCNPFLSDLRDAAATVPHRCVQLDDLDMRI